MKLGSKYDLLDTPHHPEVNICKVLKRSNELISQSMRLTIIY